jgi:undecaprenyl pyrophosphate phosphatase UppP
MPIVLVGNVLLNITDFQINLSLIVALIASFITGYASIHVLLTIAKKINFGLFVILFGVVMIIAGLLG